MDVNYYSLSLRLGKCLEKNHMLFAAAESCTGGGLCRAITQVPGSSKWFDRGFVVYSNAAKIELLDVDQQVIQTYGAVSKETAYEMALGVIKHSQADVAVSITGLAGPTGRSLDKPVGTVWFGLAKRDGFCECRKVCFDGGRRNVRDSAIMFIMKWSLEELEVTAKDPV